MKTVFVNDHEFYVVTESNKNMGISMQIGQDGQFFWLWPFYAERPWDYVLRAAGHDPNKIDYAVPQQWWDQYFKDNNKGPEAFWTYEDNLFGKPLFMKDVITKVTREIERQLLTILRDIIETDKDES